VLIHFFLVDDTYDFMPYMTESYHFFGCNTGDVFYMEVTPNGGNDAARAWAERYGVEYSTISRDGGANSFVQSIPVGFYPTVMLVNPSHEIVLPDIYPIIGTQTVIDALMGEGIEQHDCPGVGVDENETSATLFPNPANDFVTLKGESLGTVCVFNTLGQKMDEFEANGSELRINTTGYENGLYVVKAGEQTLRFVVKH
jgi:hypothetical protein